MTVEVPENVLMALSSIVIWAHSDEDLVDYILQYDVPVIADWLEQRGLLPLWAE
jgi:hypothetical protein